MADQIMKGELFFSNDQGQGWSEGYYLGAEDYTAAKATLKTIIDWRLRILAANCSLDYSVVTRQQRTDNGAKNAADGKCVTSGEMRNPNKYILNEQGVLQAVKAEDKCNDAGYGVLCRFENENGKHVNYIFRGIPDLWIEGQRLTGPVVVPEAVPQQLPGVQAGLSDCIGGFLRVVTENAKHCVISKTRVRANGRKYVINGFAKTDLKDPFFRKIAKRNLGKRFDLSRGRRKAVA